MEYLSDLVQEKEYLIKVKDILALNIDLLQQRATKALELLKEASQLYSEGEAGFYMEIPAAEQRYNLAIKEVFDNEKAQKSPYFGKTIFSYDDEKNGVGDQTFYFGKKGIADVTKDETKFIITDWRAPVAEIYYSSKLGNTSYTAPKGEVGVDLKLKTTLKIKDGELLGAYDAEVVTNDEILSEYLSQNKDVVLNEIIATIQEDQNKIIRRPLALNLIVQGVAGSGKTTVALHRIAYLLYNFKEQLQFNNVCLVAANKLFLGYITGMLPDLDVPAIKQYTIEELILSSIKIFNPKFSKNAKVIDEIPISENECYANDSYIDKIDEFEDRLISEIFDIARVSFFEFEFLSREDIEKVSFVKGMSLFKKANILDARLKDNILKNKDNIITYICQNRNDRQVATETDKLFSLRGGAILEDSLVKNFLTFCSKYKSFFKDCVKKKTAQSLFCEFTGSPCKAMLLNDLACYLKILTLLHGSDDAPDIRHIVIDEAQDFSIVVYYALKAIYPKATFTVVGDIMQNIRYNGLEDWTLLQNKIFGEHTEYAALIKSYRNTIEISEFAQETVKRLIGKSIEIEPIIRHGDPVGVHSYFTPPERIEKTQEILDQFAQKGFNMNAIICKDENEAQKLYSKLAKTTDIKHLNPEGGKLMQGNYIVSLANAKGLEFDCVIVFDYDSYQKKDVNLLYVALTRALHSLHVFSNKIKDKEQ